MEIWKDIPNYEGIYQVSNLGRVKSLLRKKWSGRVYYDVNEKILSTSCSTFKYDIVRLYKDKKVNTRTLHSLVAEVFLNHLSCGHKIVIDHINNNPKDNRAENLQVVTQRFNCKKNQSIYSSQYKGVNWDKASDKWVSRIEINRKAIFLGRFKTELEAHQAYQNKLKEII
jgi:hypothetical protein